MLEDADREENVNFIEYKRIYLSTNLPEEAKIIQKATLFTLPSPCSYFLCLVLLLFLGTCVLDPFFYKPPFSYILLLSLYLNHSFLPN